MQKVENSLKWSEEINVLLDFEIIGLVICT